MVLKFVNLIFFRVCFFIVGVVPLPEGLDSTTKESLMEYKNFSTTNELGQYHNGVSYFSVGIISLLLSFFIYLFLYYCALPLIHFMGGRGVPNY